LQIDGSGKICGRELGKIFKALNVKLHDHQLQELVKEMDSDGSGVYEKISKLEKVLFNK
jgi:Ca2+-binding EF-hand superfamily protein